MAETDTKKELQQHVEMYRDYQRELVSDVFLEVNSLAWFAGYLLTQRSGKQFDPLSLEIDRQKAEQIRNWYPFETTRLEEIASRANDDLATIERDLCNRVMGAKAIKQVIDDLNFQKFYAGFGCWFGDTHNGCGCEYDIQITGCDS